MITFNNIVERFQIFAENHFFIQTFSFGSPDDVDLSKFTNFPLMHLVYTGATYDAGTKTYNLEVYILDVPADKNQKVERQKEVVSDAEQCAEDIIADIKNGGNIFLFAQDYEVVNATTTPLEEETKNVLSGVLLDLSVAIPYEWDACNAPIDGVEPGGTEVTYARRGVLRMLTLDGATDVPSVRTIKVTNGTLTDNGDGVVTLDTGGVDTLAGLTDVDVTGVTDGQVLKYNDASGEWLPGNDQSATSLANLDDVSLATPANREALIYDGDNWVNDNVTKADVGLGSVDNTSDADKPVSTATQTALNLKANTADVPTELNDLSDVSLTTPTANQALIYNTAASAFQALPSYTNRFQDEAEQASNTAVTGTGLFIERYYSAKADGDGIFIDAQSDTPATGKVIVRKIYQIQGGLNDTTVTGWTLLTTFADDTAYSATVSTFDGYRDGDTYGTPPFTLAQTWEEQTAAPAFTGLLNETYGSGAAAAYSVRRLNGLYTGSAIQVERSSDNTTQDIGFDANGDLDESALTTFCTGTTCRVRTWYDQSQTGGTGSGNDAVQTVHTKQPIIYTGGAIVKGNGRAALNYDGIESLSATFTSAFSQPNSISAVGLAEDLEIRGTLSDGYTNRNLVNFANASGVFQIYAGSALTGSDIRGERREVFAIFNGSNSTAHVDGVQDISGNAGADTLGTRIDLGAGGGTVTPTNSLHGFMQEWILWNSDKSTDRTSIESNIGDYFSQNTPLLDTYTGAAAAYSLRKLSSSYSGSAVEVYNGTSYADIGFNVFGELDTVALAAHCGSNDGFVSTWYDQAGSNDATQTTTSLMPKIYDGTTGVVTENGKPAVECTGGNMPTGIAAGSITGDFYFTHVWSYDGNVPSARTMYFGTGAHQLLSATSVRYQIGGNQNFTVPTMSVGDQILSTLHRSSSTMAYAHQGSAIGSVTDSTATSLTHIGHNTTTSFRGVWQEIIMWSSDQSSNRTNIEDNINTFYSIY